MKKASLCVLLCLFVSFLMVYCQERDAQDCSDDGESISRFDSYYHESDDLRVTGDDAASGNPTSLMLQELQEVADTIVERPGKHAHDCYEVLENVAQMIQDGHSSAQDILGLVDDATAKLKLSGEENIKHEGFFQAIAYAVLYEALIGKMLLIREKITKYRSMWTKELDG